MYAAPLMGRSLSSVIVLGDVCAVSWVQNGESLHSALVLSGEEMGGGWCTLQCGQFNVYCVLAVSGEESDFFTGRVFGIILLVWVVVLSVLLVLLLCLYIAARRRSRRHGRHAEKHHGAGFTGLNGSGGAGTVGRAGGTELHGLGPVTPVPGAKQPDPEWIGSMKEDLVTDYSIETISDANNSAYSAYTLPTHDKYARVKRHHLNGDVTSRSSLPSYS